MEVGLRPTNYEVDPNHKSFTGDALALNTDACSSQLAGLGDHVLVRVRRRHRAAFTGS